jgi:outer membrane protein assembly factor BamB
MNKGTRSLISKCVCAILALAVCAILMRERSKAQDDLGWRISPEKINIQVNADRTLQVLDDNAQEPGDVKWFADKSALAEIHEDGGRAILHAKAPGTLRVTAMRNGESRFREVVIWPADQEIPQGITTWGMHPIGRELGDISAFPVPDGPQSFSLEQTPGGRTYLRAVTEDGIQVWSWFMPETTRDVELVCGDWLGGALISANRKDSFTLYTVGKDGKLSWQRTLAGIRKGHAYNRDHLAHILTQSADGTTATLYAIDSATGQLKFELPIPQSFEHRTNIRRDGEKFLCSKDSDTGPTRTFTSGLFVNIDGFAYIAFSRAEQTLEGASCTPGTVVEPRNIRVSSQKQLVLWQIHADGKRRETVAEESKVSHSLSEAASQTLPTGSIIPDGLDGVLLSIRRSEGTAGVSARVLPQEFVYRLDKEGKVVYRFSLPAFRGPLHDGMVLGEDNQAFATRGGLLIVFDVQEGKEAWRWNSMTDEVEVVAALANGSCLVQTAAETIKVDSATNSSRLLEGHIMIDWQGHMYRKHS